MGWAPAPCFPGNAFPTRCHVCFPLIQSTASPAWLVTASLKQHQPTRGPLFDLRISFQQHRDFVTLSIIVERVSVFVVNLARGLLFFLTSNRLLLVAFLTLHSFTPIHQLSHHLTIQYILRQSQHSSAGIVLYTSLFACRCVESPSKKPRLL